MSKLEELVREAEALIRANGDGLEDKALERYEELTDQIEREKQMERLRASVNDPNTILESGDGSIPPRRGGDLYATAEPKRPAPRTPDGQIQGEAFRSVDSWRADDEIKQAATEKLERTHEVRGFSEHILLTGNPDYIGAFNKHLADPESGYQTFTNEERTAWGRVKEYQRAALGLSGAVLPSPLDPAIVLTNAGALDPMRRLARIDQTTSKSKRYVTSAGVTASFDGELVETSDDTPSLTEVEIDVEKAQAFVQASIEAAMDQPDFASIEVPRLMADAKARLESDKFINGSGTNEPFGIWTQLDGTASELSPATVEVFASADVYTTAEGLPARWQPNARWQAELSTLNKIDQFETGNGAKLFPRVGDADPVLLRRTLAENSAVDAHSSINPAATADNPILFYGDWNQYVILDRIGGTLEFIPHLLNTANNLPDGRRGWYYFWRTGAETLTTNAFRVMNIATTA